MEEVQTWRELLAKVIGDSQERQRIAEALHVNPITLIRWTTGKSNPRQDNLRPLLDALPRYRQELIELISQEFPHFWAHTESGDDNLLDIPSAFYARIISAYTSSPTQLRTSSVCMLLLQQISGHLDPQRLGLAVVVFQCVAPVAGHKVHSLRKTLSRVTGTVTNYSDNWTQFVGAESQVGHAVFKGHQVTVLNSDEKARMFPTHHIAQEESTVTSPILLADRVAGALCVSSTQPNYFTQAHLDLIQNYVDLMMLAFEPHEFYDLGSIELGIMPPREVQQPYIASFHQRVTQRLIKATQEHQPLTRPMVEPEIWQEIESELLHIEQP